MNMDCMNLTTESTEHTEKGEASSLTGKIIGAAIEIHRALGPGLLESAYEACLSYELRLKKLKVEPQKSMPVFYTRLCNFLGPPSSSICPGTARPMVELGII